ncbi:hypothetical protein Tco_1000518 [Tanacetum coccineum]
MNVINMSMRVVQVNTKFLNSLPPEWSKFVTDVKLARDLHSTNYDQLYSYLEKHEVHANETRLMRERYQDPLAFTEDLDAYYSDCDDVSNAQAVLMANLSNYGFDVILEVPHSDSYHNDMDNQSVHAMQDFEQTSVVDFSNDEIHSDSNIIPYSQYLQETQLAAVQDTNLQTQQDSMILSVIEQMSKQMINHVNN